MVMQTIHAANERHRQYLTRKAEAWAIMTEVREAAAAENRDMTGEEMTRWETAEVDLREASRLAELEERSAGYSREIGAGRVDPRIHGAQGDEGDRSEAEARYDRAFEGWMRRGLVNLSPEEQQALRSGFSELTPEQRAQSVGTNSAGGYAVPSGFAGYIVEQLASLNAVRRAVALCGGEPLTTSSGIAIPFPTNNDTGNTGELLGENTAVAETADLTLGQTTLNSYIFSSKLVRASLALLEDEDVDLERYLGRMLANRIARAQNTYFTTGSGSSQPNGIVTAGTTVTAAAAAAIAYADLVTLTDAVVEPYRQNGGCAFMMKQSTMTAIRKLLDSQNRPLWEPSLKLGVPDQLMGWPYVINEDMAAIATTNKTVVFGDFKAYQIRDVRGVTLLRLAERYAESLQVGFIGFHRSDADLLDTAAIRVLVQA